MSLPHIKKRNVVVTAAFVSCVLLVIFQPSLIRKMNNEQFLTSFKNILQTTSLDFFNTSDSNSNMKNASDECCSSAYWDKLFDSNLLTGTQLLKYFMWTNQTSCLLSHDFGGAMSYNPSGLDGQKAVCIDPEVAPKPGNCLIYSFGIHNEWSFDEQMERYGCEVFAFDPSMGVDSYDHRPRIHFYNWGLSDRDEILEEESGNWTVYSLSSIYENLSSIHSRKIIDYLKIDIEYDEWIALPQIIRSGMLSKVRQLGIEIHLHNQLSFKKHIEWAQMIRSIEKLGMVRFDSKYNPWWKQNFTKFNLRGSLGYEIAWYNGYLVGVF